MVRYYRPKTNRKRDIDLMERAVREVQSGRSVRQVSRDLKIDRITLSRYVKKMKEDHHDPENIFKPNYNHKQVSR